LTLVKPARRDDALFVFLYDNCVKWDIRLRFRDGTVYGAGAIAGAVGKDIGKAKDDPSASATVILGAASSKTAELQQSNSGARMFTLGLDYGTNSVRELVVRCSVTSTTVSAS
jgi:hypothetical protein